MMNVFRHDGEMPAKLAARIRWQARIERQPHFDDPSFDLDLALALNFTPQDLAANRDGVISAEQHARLRRMAYFGVDVFGGITALAIFGVILLITAHTGRSQILSLLETVCLLILLSALYGSIILLLWRRRNAYRKDLLSVRVVSISGQAILELRGQLGKVRIGSKTFWVSKIAYNRFKNSHSYTLYYTPSMEVVLSAEPLEAS